MDEFIMNVFSELYPQPRMLIIGIFNFLNDDNII